MLSRGVLGITIIGIFSLLNDLRKAYMFFFLLGPIEANIDLSRTAISPRLRCKHLADWRTSCGCECDGDGDADGTEMTI